MTDSPSRSFLNSAHMSSTKRKLVEIVSILQTTKSDDKKNLKGNGLHSKAKQKVIW